MWMIKTLYEVQYEQWLPMWQGYQAFYETRLTNEVSQQTWQRLTDPSQSHMYGFAVCIAHEMVGLVHVIEHDSCWTLKPYAYLQDLYVDQAYRGKGMARQLIETVYQTAQMRQCDRVYWLTHEGNHIAQQLYDCVAQKTGFLQYRMP